MKETHPVEVAEYARARGIDKEPAFEWWVPHTLKKRQVVLAAFKKRIRKTTHNYGIESPTSVEHAFELDRKNGNNLWNDALEMEMCNIGVAFEIHEDGKTAPAGYTKVSGHLIWSVKMDFTRKARWVWMVIKHLIQLVPSMQELSQERVYELPSPIQPKMNLICAWQTSGMPMFNPQHPKSTISSVDQSLEWKTLARWLSCIEQSMVEK